MNVLDVIKNRRSIHTFKTEEIDEEIIEEIFTYASWAPNHFMKEPWNLKIYQSTGKQIFVQAIIESYQRIGMMPTDKSEKALKTIHFIRDFLLAIPHHVLIYFEKNEDAVRYEEDYSAIAAFIQNAQLASWAYNVGMLWTITPFMHDAGFYESVGLDPKKEKIAAVMQMGYPESVPKKKERTPMKNKIEYIKE